MITTVLLTLQSLLDENPLHHEPGQEKNIGHTNILYNEIYFYYHHIGGSKPKPGHQPGRYLSYKDDFSAVRKLTNRAFKRRQNHHQFDSSC